MLSGVTPASSSSGPVKKRTVGDLMAETEKIVRKQFKGLKGRTLTEGEEGEVRKLARALCMGTLKDMGKI